MIANSPAAWSERAASEPDPAAAVRWSQAGQAERHEAVLAALELRERETLLDFGCGTGAFYDRVPDGVRYTGYDWAPGMIARALTDHPVRDTVVRVFTTTWPTSVFDAVAAVGPFNLADSWSKQKTWETLGRLWEQTGRILVASLYRGDDPDCLRYDAEAAVRFSVTCAAASAFVDEYRDNDMLLVMNR